jgi:hypothetical protein
MYFLIYNLLSGKHINIWRLIVQILPNNILERISNEAVVSSLKHNLEIIFERLRKIARNVNRDDDDASEFIFV